jgi:NhaP-type Na+/H+ or K+/H+ antiporter
LYFAWLRSQINTTDLTSIFQCGRAVSLAAPPVTGAFAEAVGLSAAMGLAAAAFVTSGLIWPALPEAHHRSAF